jgi:hypothetical protein
MALKDHYSEHPELGTVMTGEAVIHFIAAGAYGRTAGAGSNTQKLSRWALDYVIDAVRKARFAPVDILETKLARGDRDDAPMAMIKSTLHAVGGGAAIHGLIEGAYTDARRRLAEGE